MPIDEKDVIVKCYLVLVYIKPGIYGEVKEIRAPAIQDSVSSRARNTSPDKTMNVDTTEGHNKSLEFTAMTVLVDPVKLLPQEGYINLQTKPLHRLQSYIKDPQEKGKLWTIKSL